MKSEVKSKWTAALRSGDYKQAKKALRTVDNRFCCLGVLCEILAPGNWRRHFDDDGWDHDGCESLPSDDIGKLADIDEPQVEALAELNDSGQSFAEIADYIEKTL